jgi:hypothetical protein
VSARWLLLLSLCLFACDDFDNPAQASLANVAATAAVQDYSLLICRRRIAEIRKTPGLPGAPAFDDARIAFIGRAAGEPVVFVEAPPSLAVPADPGVDTAVRIGRTLSRYGRSDRRARLLRGGYLYADDPEEAFELVDRLTLANLFDEDELWLQRGAQIHRIERRRWHEAPGFAYRHSDGPWQGQPAVLLFADRIARSRREFERPLHRDVKSLRDSVGFDRMRVLHRTENTLVAQLRFDESWLEALISADGVRLSLECFAASKSSRDAASRWVDGQAPRRRAIAALRTAVDALVAERLPFDRPHDADDHLTDGRLRPHWEKAYRLGRHGFGMKDRGYPVFDVSGRPHPPQTCVAMVLDAYERASGTWYRQSGERRERHIGALDFDAYGIDNRSGVLGFERFAQRQPELFVHRRIVEEERIPYRDRKAFFRYLTEHASEFSPGDIVAIQGVKRDGNIHQHAILIEDLDPLTGFANVLVDQMTRPRRRTWEDIMAEAPARSLLYHLRPKTKLLARLLPHLR